MKFTIIGFKSLENEGLTKLVSELQEAENILPYSSSVKEAIKELKFKVSGELSKRERSKFVWVEFESFWSGYTSGQRKLVGKFYRKLNKSLVEKMPKYFEHKFTDNTSNAWHVKVVSVRGKDEGSYSNQVDEFLIKHKPSNPTEGEVNY